MRRSSRQRDSIRENLARRTDHPTADMVYEDIRKIYPKVSLGTVYRNLALLAGNGEIQKIACPDGADRFDGSTEPHTHFVCRVCGRVFDLPGVAVGDLLREARKDSGLGVEGCSLIFTGICSECSNKNLAASQESAKNDALRGKEGT